MKTFRGVLFDKDGTLFDFQATWSAWAREFIDDLAGGDAARATVLGAAIGYDIVEGVFVPDSPVIAGTPGTIAQLLLPHLPGACPASLITRMNTAAAEAPMIEAVPLVPLLQRLRSAGYALGVATNDAAGPARAHLEGIGVDGLFDFVAGFDSGYGAKPQPGMMLAFADRMGLHPSEVLVVGDSRHDLIAARAAGMKAVGVLTGLAQEADLAPLAEAVLPNIGHLPAWLPEIFESERMMMESVA